MYDLPFTNADKSLTGLNLFFLQDAAQKAEIQAYLKSNTPDIWGRRERAQRMIATHEATLVVKRPFRMIIIESLGPELEFFKNIGSGVQKAWLGMCKAGRNASSIIMRYESAIITTRCDVYIKSGCMQIFN